MNILVEKGVLKELECGSNFAYVLSDNSDFLSTEYKVLQSQSDSNFIKCMKMLYNGQTELYYLLDSYVSLHDILSHVNFDQFTTIVANLLSGIIDVKNNGFLNSLNIDSSFEHIYVDPATYKVGLVYLPLKKHEYPDFFTFENEVRSKLIDVLSTSSMNITPAANMLLVDLQNGTMSIRDLCTKIFDGYYKQNKMIKMKLQAINAPVEGFELLVSKPQYFIGRIPGYKDIVNDGVVNFDKTIGRSHCKITHDGVEFSVTDLNSKNCTFLNGTKLEPFDSKKLKNGDELALAKWKFKVVIA